MGPGMRICLAIKAPPAGEELSLRDGPVRLGTLRSVATTDAPSEWPPALPANPIAEPDVANAEKINFNFEWVGSVSENQDGDQPPSLWQINGIAWDIKDKTCADRPIAKLKLGQSYIFELKNMTQYQHPIHLHGMSFNMLASIGAFGFGLIQVYFFLFVVVPAMRGKGEKAPQRPWEGAEGLEWEVPSPAPFHTFENPPKLDATATRVIG